MFLQAIALTIAQVVVLLVVSPVIVGLIRKVKARLQCRRGASLFQPYADLAKLFNKEPVISTTTSWIFTATPYIVFSATLTAGLLVPLFASQVPLNFAGNIIALVYLFAIGTFFLMLAGLDAGSAFGGMGSSREAIVASLTEPAAILAIFAIALTAGSTNLSTIVHKTALLDGIVTAPSPHLMAFAALFIVTLAETGRVPVDNPATHLELTMIHEAMVLEYSGRHLALIEWAAGIKLTVFLTLLANVFAPWGIATTLTPLALTIGAGRLSREVAGLAALIGTIEMHVCQIAPLPRDRSAGRGLHPGVARPVVLLHFTRLSVSWLTPHIGSHIVDLGSALLLLTCFAIVAQRRLSACVDLFALQSLFLAMTAAFVAFLTGTPHIYFAAALTVIVKVIVIPRVLRRVIERLNVTRELVMNINVPASLLICGALVMIAFFITQPIIPFGHLLTRDSLAIALAIVLIGFFTMIARQKAVTQMIAFLVMENGLFLGATAATYGMPLIVELGVFFDVLVAALIAGIYTNHLQDAFDSVDTSHLSELKE